MLTHNGTQTIYTDRLILRKFSSNDADNMFKNWATDENVTRFLAWQPHKDIEFTKNLINQWIEQYKNNTTYHWVIELKENEEPIGDIALFHLDEKNHSCEVGYCLSSKFWNKGIMSEAVNSIIDYLFSQVGFNRIIGRHHTNNIASGKVMINSNMKYEGTLRQAKKYTDKDEFYDLSLYSIIKSDWIK